MFIICLSELNPCATIKCGHDMQCFINEDDNSATCQCAHVCDAVMRPVCGVVRLVEQYVMDVCFAGWRNIRQRM
jgi:hypothetical protein